MHFHEFVKIKLCKASVYKWTHEQIRQYYFKVDTVLNILVAIINVLSGVSVMSIIQQKVYCENFMPLQIAFGAISILAGLILGIKQYMGYAEKISDHKAMIYSYMKFINKLKTL